MASAFSPVCGCWAREKRAGRCCQVQRYESRCRWGTARGGAVTGDPLEQRSEGWLLPFVYSVFTSIRWCGLRNSAFLLKQHPVDTKLPCYLHRAAQRVCTASPITRASPSPSWDLPVGNSPGPCPEWGGHPLAWHLDCGPWGRFATWASRLVGCCCHVLVVVWLCCLAG